jgi:hypothetical protein
MTNPGEQHMTNEERHMIETTFENEEAAHREELLRFDRDDEECCRIRAKLESTGVADLSSTESRFLLDCVGSMQWSIRRGRRDEVKHRALRRCQYQICTVARNPERYTPQEVAIWDCIRHLNKSQPKDSPWSCLHQDEKVAVFTRYYVDGKKTPHGKPMPYDGFRIIASEPERMLDRLKRLEAMRWNAIFGANYDGKVAFFQDDEFVEKLDRAVEELGKQMPLDHAPWTWRFDCIETKEGRVTYATTGVFVVATGVGLGTEIGLDQVEPLFRDEPADICALLKEHWEKGQYRVPAAPVREKMDAVIEQLDTHMAPEYRPWRWGLNSTGGVFVSTDGAKYRFDMDLGQDYLVEVMKRVVRGDPNWRDLLNRG